MLFATFLVDLYAMSSDRADLVDEESLKEKRNVTGLWSQNNTCHANFRPQWGAAAPKTPRLTLGAAATQTPQLGGCRPQTPAKINIECRFKASY